MDADLDTLSAPWSTAQPAIFCQRQEATPALWASPATAGSSRSHASASATCSPICRDRPATSSVAAARPTRSRSCWPASPRRAPPPTARYCSSTRPRSSAREAARRSSARHPRRSPTPATAPLPPALLLGDAPARSLCA